MPPVTPRTPRTRGRPPKYSTPEERAQARLVQSRQNLQRYRERQKAKRASPLSPTDRNSSQQSTIQEDNDDQESRSVILFTGNSPEFPSESRQSDSSSRNTTSSSPTYTINFERSRIYLKDLSPISPIKTLRLPAGNYLIPLLYYLC